jgi:hypothetical protein
MYIHAPDALLVDTYAKSGSQRVKRRVLHAIVGGEAADRHLVDPAVSQPALEPSGFESRVPLRVWILALVDDHIDPALVERGVQLGAGAPRHAVLRPRPAARGEGSVVWWMPVAGSDDKIELARGGKLVDPLGDLISMRYRECSSGREVVLEVDDDQCPSHVLIVDRDRMLAPLSG